MTKNLNCILSEMGSQCFFDYDMLFLNRFVSLLLPKHMADALRIYSLIDGFCHLDSLKA